MQKFLKARADSSSVILRVLGGEIFPPKFIVEVAKQAPAAD